MALQLREALRSWRGWWAQVGLTVRLLQPRLPPGAGSTTHSFLLHSGPEVLTAVTESELLIHKACRTPSSQDML